MLYQKAEGGVLTLAPMALHIFLRWHLALIALTGPQCLGHLKLPPQTHNTHPEEKSKKMDGTKNATDESVRAESPF